MRFSYFVCDRCCVFLSLASLLGDCSVEDLLQSLSTRRPEELCGLARVALTIDRACMAERAEACHSEIRARYRGAHASKGHIGSIHVGHDVVDGDASRGAAVENLACFFVIGAEIVEGKRMGP